MDDFKDFSVLQTADGTANAEGLPEIGADGSGTSHLDEVGGASRIVLENQLRGIGFSNADITALQAAGFTDADLQAINNRISAGTLSRQLVIDIADKINTSATTFNGTADQILQRQFEGKAARGLLFDVKNVEVAYPPSGGLVTRLDVVTDQSLIEVTLGKGKGKVAQLQGYVDASKSLYGSRPVILYGPDIPSNTAQQAAKSYLGKAPPNVYIICNDGLWTNDVKLTTNSLGVTNRFGQMPVTAGWKGSDYYEYILKQLGMTGTAPTP